MNHFCLSLILVALTLSTSVSAMGFTNIFAHVHEKSDEEVGLLKQLMEDTHYTAQPLTIFPRRIGKINAKHQSVSKKRRSQHKYMANMQVTQSYSSHDEELIERLVELQH